MIRLLGLLAALALLAGCASPAGSPAPGAASAATGRVELGYGDWAVAEAFWPCTGPDGGALQLRVLPPGPVSPGEGGTLPIAVHNATAACGSGGTPLQITGGSLQGSADRAGRPALPPPAAAPAPARARPGGATGGEGGGRAGAGRALGHRQRAADAVLWAGRPRRAPELARYLWDGAYEQEMPPARGPLLLALQPWPGADGVLRLRPGERLSLFSEGAAEDPVALLLRGDRFRLLAQLSAPDGRWTWQGELPADLSPGEYVLCPGYGAPCPLHLHLTAP